MKASIIASSLALFSGALASPMVAARAAAPVEQFTFSLTNDFTGANAPASVGINIGPVALRTLFPMATNLWKDGKLIATSANNIKPGVPNVRCIFTNPATGGAIEISDQITFADLDGNKDQAIPTDVTNFTISCRK